MRERGFLQIIGIYQTEEKLLFTVKLLLFFLIYLMVMIYLIEGVLPESYFANSLRGLSIDMAVFRDLLRLKLPRLSRHLENLQNDSNGAGNTYEPPLTNVFTMQWFLTLFCNCLPHSTVLRVWDLIFLEGNQILLKTALAIWDTLSDRILPVKSADEFYSILGVLTREMLEFGLMDANTLIKTITNIELAELTELRERYIYNITPWSQVARKGLRLFYSDNETDDSEEEKVDDKASEGAYGFLKAATRQGSQSIRSISPSSILVTFASEKDKIALDISSLKKQYCKIKERQRQAQIIFSAACSTENLMASVTTPRPNTTINHLLLNKSITTPSVKNKYIQRQMTPVSRAVQRLKETSVSLDDIQKDRGETVYWNKRMKKKRRRHRTEIYLQKSCGCDVSKQEIIDSDTSNSSCSTSPKSSSSTELCDEMPECDSEDANTSISECCSSPRRRLHSSSTSLKEECTENVKAHNKSELDVYDSDHSRILNVLLTTSIIANDQLKRNDDNSSITEISQTAHKNHLNNQIYDDNIPHEKLNSSLSSPSIKLNNLDFSDNVVSTPFQLNENENSKSAGCFIDENDNQISKERGHKNVSSYCEDILNTNYELDSEATINSLKNVSNEELNTALEHMKIDALEILLSSTTLENIKKENLPLNDRRKRFSFDDEKIIGRVDNLLYDSDQGRDNDFDVIENPCFTSDTEIALKEILNENTEVLKKINKNNYFNNFSEIRKNGKCLNNYNVHLSDENLISMFDEDECMKQKCMNHNEKKHKSLDNLNSKSKLKIGLVSKTGKWISISIDNSDLEILNTSSNYRENNTSGNTVNFDNHNLVDSCEKSSQSHELPFENKYDSSSVNHLQLVNGKTNFLEEDKQNSSSYLHINFDIIPSSKKKDPIKDYKKKKNSLFHSFKSYELPSFNPFPNRLNHKPPKELGIKLGLYSSKN